MKLLSLILACFISMVGVYGSEPPLPQDFAWGVELRLLGVNALYELELPPEVYRGSVHGDLSDMRVFNAAGEVVPYVLHRSEMHNVTTELGRKVPFFPIMAAPKQLLDGLSLHVKRSSDGTIVDLNATNQPDKHSRLIAYVLDTATLKRIPHALIIDWTGNETDFVTTLMIEASDDLQHWKTLAQGTVARLHFQGHMLNRSRLELPEAALSPYMRISWPLSDVPPPVHSIELETVEQRSEPLLEQQWLHIKAETTQPARNEIIFDLGGFFPVEQLNIHLPQRNTFVHARLISGETIAGITYPAWEGVLYDLHVNGENLQTPPIRLIPHNHRYLLLKLDNDEAGIGDGMPELDIAWTPHKLAFLARGKGPFQLAWGSATIGAAQFAITALLDKLQGDQQHKLQVQQVNVGKVFVLGGEARLHSPPAPFPWRRWILWSILIFGVALLGWMSLYLYKQLGTLQPGNKSD